MNHLKLLSQANCTTCVCELKKERSACLCWFRGNLWFWISVHFWHDNIFSQCLRYFHFYWPFQLMQCTYSSVSSLRHCATCMLSSSFNTISSCDSFFPSCSLYYTRLSPEFLKHRNYLLSWEKIFLLSAGNFRNFKYMPNLFLNALLKIECHFKPYYDLYLMLTYLLTYIN